MPRTIRFAQQLPELWEQGFLVSDEFPLSEQLVMDYCAVVGDRQWIHDAARTEEPVVPGNLLVSLIPRLLQSMFSVGGAAQCLTGAYRSIRFRHRVRADDTVRLSVTAIRVTRRGDREFVDMDISMTCQAREVMTARVTDVYVD